MCVCVGERLEELAIRGEENPPLSLPRSDREGLAGHRCLRYLNDRSENREKI